MWQVRYLLIFNCLLILYKSKTIVKIKHQILCVCTCMCVKVVFVLLLFAFFLIQNCANFYLLFNYMIIIKLKHMINMERVTACVSGHNVFPGCIVFYCCFFLLFLYQWKGQIPLLPRDKYRDYSLVSEIIFSAKSYNQ